MTFFQLTIPSRRWLELAPFLRRAFDLILATVALVCLGPVMLLIGVAILVDSGRPIFFSQLRLGQWGRPFRMYKFRKFRTLPDTYCGLVTVKNDPRFTRLGRLLEMIKLDELPQLWNILKGDMSIVGPRPESVELGSCFTGPQLKVLEHRPGIFGPNQYYFRDEKFLYPCNSDPELFYREVLFPCKARIDMAYFSSRTILSDLAWIVRGVARVLHLPNLRGNRLDGMHAQRTADEWLDAAVQPDLPWRIGAGKNKGAVGGL
jgi:lipopolysaccharide/colanic/teichoic acid biosynthesis glycosyltransferase